MECCENSHQTKQKPWYFSHTFLSLALFSFLYAASFVHSAFTSFRTTINMYLEMIFWPIVIGFLLGGVIDYYVPKEYISKHLARTKKRTILYSVGLGFLMSACSHGILALSIELHKKGASGPAVVSFLLASPWANLPITLLLIGFFGVIKGFVIIISSLLIALITGYIFQILDRHHLIERNIHTVSVKEDFSIRRDLLDRFRRYQFTSKNLMNDFRGVLKGSVALMDMVLWWLVIGILLAGIVSAFVPSHIFHQYFGPSLTGLFFTLLAATVFEVCSEGTSPLAFEIYKQTGAFGNAFAFLMGGVVTDYTEVGLIWMRLGKKTALWMLAITIPQVILLGWMLNVLF